MNDIMRRYQVRLIGVTDLLMHSDGIEWGDKMIAWRKIAENKKLSVPGDDRHPGFTWLGSLYHDGKRLCIPSDNLMAMLRDGGGKVSTGKGQKTYRAQTQSGIIVDQATWPMLVNGKEIQWEPLKALMGELDFEQHQEVARQLGFELFARRATINNKKHIRVRPRFTNWEVSGTVTVTDKDISKATLNEILRTSGDYCGLGDWRPGSPKPGQFGRFIAEVTE